MEIFLSPNNPTPFYQQIVDQIKERILAGDLPSGVDLPSIRKLARELTTSVITVKRAYQELEKEGWVVTRQGMGTFVTPIDDEKRKKIIEQRVVRHLHDALTEADKGRISRQQVIEMLLRLSKGDEKNE